MIQRSFSSALRVHTQGRRPHIRSLRIGAIEEPYRPSSRRYNMTKSLAIFTVCAVGVILFGCRDPSEGNDAVREATSRRLPPPVPEKVEPVPKAGTASSIARSVASPLKVPEVVTPAEGPGVFAGQKVVLLSLDSQIALALDEVKAEFEAATGAELEIVRRPLDEVYLEFVNDAMAPEPRLDGVIAGAWWIGDFISKKLIRDYDDYLGDERFPPVDLEDVLEAPRALLSYDGKNYMVPYDHDGQTMYYRRDIFADKDHRAAFAAEYGYPLAPPETWSQFRDMAAYFNGKDLNGDGDGDYGFVVPLRIGAQAMNHFMSFSAPFVIGPENPKLYWFDPKDLRPIIDSPGNQRALERMLELVQYGPPEMVEWDLGQSWDMFLQGRVALTFTWADLGGLSQEEGSKVKGKTGSTMLPGTMEYYAIDKKRWVKTEKPNRVGNTTGGSWAGVISAHSDAPEATYFLLALLASREKSVYYAARGADGVDPGRMNNILEPQGNAEVATYLRLGWNEQDVRDFHAAIYDNFSNPLQFPYLRIPGSYSYWVVLDTYLFRAAAKQISPTEALKGIKAEFEEITNEHGRDELRDIYRRSLGL